VVANVAYDIWIASAPGGNPVYEVMIWIGALGGAGPISETGSPIASPTVLGSQWNLFKGPGPDNAFTVFSFVTRSNMQTFGGDLKPFLDYLTSSQGVSADMTLTGLGAGTEPFTGEWIFSDP
jgi:xyloglucan-specific endo-beta-1,4-glucanase